MSDLFVITLIHCDYWTRTSLVLSEDVVGGLVDGVHQDGGEVAGRRTEIKIY